MSTADLLLLGRELDAHGFDGREIAVRAVIRDARSHGVAPVAISVLADLGAPEVARLRAFGIVSVELAKVARRDHPSIRVA